MSEELNFFCKNRAVGSQGGCEGRSEAIVKIKKNRGMGGGVGSG